MKNIGLVGFGYIGKTHFEGYRHIGNAQVAAICTRSMIEAQDLPNHYQGSIVTDYDELLTMKEIDIIDICLPTFLHEEYIIKAANAGKQIICEKPLTLTVESANRIIETVQNNKIRLFVGQVLRFWPEYKAIHSLNKTDQLGEIELVHAKRLGQVPNWSDWFLDPEKSGGALLDLHIHDLDFVYHMLGEIESVYAVGTQNKLGAWDHIMTTLSFKNKCKAFVEASQRMPTGYPFTMSFRAQGTKGTLDFQVIAGENIENISNIGSQLVYYRNGSQVLIQFEKEDAFQNELSYFVNCVEHNQDNDAVPLEDVLYTLKLVKAIEASLKTKSVVWM